MTRQRNRITPFDIRSVQLMAACTLGLAGLASNQSAPSSPSGGAKTSLSSAAGTAHTQRHNAPATLRRTETLEEQKKKAA
jgi:hypothetical protein